MKILHIGDIHIGCQLDNLRRHDELEKVFAFLAETVRRNVVRAALLAGDVFDTGAPGNESQSLYYRFLVSLRDAGCRQIVIIAGNHDSAKFLEAPRELLEVMDIHVIGRIDPAAPEQEVIPLGAAEDPAALVCAVPFLRERDVRDLVPESEDERSRCAAFSDAVVRHYRTVWELADKRRAERAIPIIGMGHFFALGSAFAGTVAADGGTAAPVGALPGIDVRDFPAFDYLALGHIHRPQALVGHPGWVYAGSLLNMDIRENMYVPRVMVVDTAAPAAAQSVEIPASCFRQMRIIRGDMASLREQLLALRSDEPVWVKPIYTGAEVRLNWQADLLVELRDTNVQIVHPEVERRAAEKTAEPAPPQPLSRMTPEQVFRETLDADPELTDEAQKTALLELYRQVQARVLGPDTAKEAPAREYAGRRMRFLRLYMKNINSLYGENIIDFTDPAFAGGIFLISGPTGAGKSSILDAISLALYGKTPRMKEAPTKNRDEAMSEGASELAAELTFQLGDDRYVARFSHQRTIRAEYPFGQTRHELSCNGQDVEGSATAIRSAIIELIGLDAEQFTRCVLLAQGGFDAFLKSDAANRFKILQTITGTDVYARLGQGINAACAEVCKRYEETQTRLKDCVVIPEAELAELKQAVAQDTQAQKVREARRDELTRQLALFEAVRTGQQRLTEAEAAQAAARQAIAAAADRFELQKTVRRAESCLPALRECRLRREKTAETEKNLADLERQSVDLQSRAETAKKQLSENRKVLADCREKRQKEQTLFQLVRALDVKLQQASLKLSGDRDALKRSQAELAACRERFQAAKQALQTFRAASQEAEEYVKARPLDADLERNRPLWEQTRAALFAREEKLRGERKRLDALRRTLEESGKQLDSLRAQAEQAKKAVAEHRALQQRNEAERQTLLNGKTREELLEALTSAMNLQAFYRQAAGYEEVRRTLKDGERCPLCGAEEHPFCRGEEVAGSLHDAEVAEFKARLKKLDACERIRLAAAQRENTLCADLSRAENALVQAETAERAARADWEKDEAHLKLDAAAADRDVREFAETLRTALQAEWTDHRALPPELDARIRFWAQEQEAVRQFAERRQAFEKTEAAFTQESQLLEKAVKNAERLTEADGKICACLKQERTALFAGDVVQAEAETTRRLSVLETADAKLVQASERAAADCRNNEETRQKLRARLDGEFVPARQAAEAALLAVLQQAGFADEAALSALEPHCAAAARNALDAELKQLESAGTAAAAKVAECRKNLAETRARIPADAAEENVRSELEKEKAALTELLERLTGMNARLQADAETRKRMGGLLQELEQIQTDRVNWKYLDSRFGNQSGDKFAKIAQGYTFRELIELANRNRLTALRRHFTLQSDRNEPLELNVIDHYRNDAVRTSRNLSGGESFEVSLALALGLADMSAGSQRASLGTVLLDEGFGTLDDNALESALALLMELRRSDKLVGIISHVGKLQEKIDARIDVGSRNGIGILSGAGVVRVAPPAAAPAAPRRGRRKKAQG